MLNSPSQRVCTIFVFPPAKWEITDHLRALQTVLWTAKPRVFYQSSEKWYLGVVLTYMSLINSQGKHLFLCVRAASTFSSVNCPCTFTHFLLDCWSSSSPSLENLFEEYLIFEWNVNESCKCFSPGPSCVAFSPWLFLLLLPMGSLASRFCCQIADYPLSSSIKNSTCLSPYCEFSRRRLRFY